MKLGRGFMMVVPIVVLAAGCGGLPGAYVEALKNATPNATVCAYGGEPIVASVVRMTNPGELPMEFQSVEFPDASPQPTEVYVVSVPTDETIGFGTGSLDDPGGGSPILAAAWDARSTLPAVVPPGSNGEVLVVLDSPTDPVETNYVHEVELTVTVGDDSESRKIESLVMTGTEAACEVTSNSLLPSDG